MKVSIITFHNTSNFGATLQCLALFNYLTNLNQDVEVINYLPSYVKNKKGVKKELKKIGKAKNKIKALLKGLAYLAHAKQIKNRDSRFEQFINQNLKLSRVYHESFSLKEDPPCADLYICGSDQIWNPVLTGGVFDEAFFLRFTDGVKVSYGTSMGELAVENYAEELKELTGDFSMLSTREHSTAERLSRIIEQPVKTVLDCTLLLNMEDYSRYEEPVNATDKPYLLYYSMQRSAIAETVARRIAELHGLDIIDISPNPMRSLKGSKKMFEIGPGEFLTLFKNAHYVVTNSFHGTVFSILYKKQFMCTLHSTRGGRVQELLASLGLTDRIAKDKEGDYIKVIDYEAVYLSLRKLRMESQTYLYQAMEICK